MRQHLARLVGCAAVVLLHATAGCAQNPPATSTSSATSPSTTQAVAADTTGRALVPAGFGNLKQDEIAIKLQLPDVLVKLTPLDESVIRTLSPDSYRALRELADSRRPAIARLAAQHGLLRGNLWYAAFYGLAPDARFSPLELTVSSGGRDYRPVEALPLTSGFGEQRLQPREMQTALYLFEDELDVNQPMVVSLGSARNAGWVETLEKIERARAAIRSRAQARTGTPPP